MITIIRERIDGAQIRQIMAQNLVRSVLIKDTLGSTDSRPYRLDSIGKGDKNT